MNYKLMTIRYVTDYSHNDTTITLVNANRQITPDGEYRALGGRAWRFDPEEQGKFYLQLDGVPFTGDCK